MFGEKIRCSQDLKLFEDLSNEPLVKKSKEQIDQYFKDNPVKSTRRQLLSTSLRLSKQISPKLYQMGQECVETLGIELPVELYVYSSPQFNAACYKPEQGRLYIIFSSSIIEAFDEDELRYVLGHELGHHLYRHHDIPLGFMMNSKNRPPSALALKLFTWSRYAEISADRAGAACVKNFKSVASALFKLSSGISDYDLVKFDLDAYLKQIDDLILDHSDSVDSTPMQDWFSTHPFSPLRVKALKHFFDSSLMKEEGITKEELEVEVEKVLNVMEPDYMQGSSKEATALRELFISAALMLLMSDDHLSKDEKNLFSKLLDNKINIDVLNLDRLKEELEPRMNKVNEIASKFQKFQLLRDLCLLAGSDQMIDFSEVALLKQIAKSLSLEELFIEQQLGKTAKLD